MSTKLIDAAFGELARGHFGPGLDEPVAAPYVETAAEFLAGEDVPDQCLVGELVAAGRTVLLHAEPRTRKTWAGLELIVAAATATPAFGLERFAVPKAVPAWWLQQEDGRNDSRTRLRRLLLGRGIETPPAELFVTVHAAINIESGEWQDRVISDVKERNIRLIAFDPIRRFSPNSDKGPGEVRFVTGFMRRLTVETGVTVTTVHHDVKPSATTEDTRRSGHRASGGDWFAASDCPIGFRPAGSGKTLVVPEDFKFGTDPKPFTFSIEEDEDKTWARLVGEDVEGTDVGSVALHERILEFLTHAPGSSGNAIAKGVHAAKQSVLHALQDLLDADRVDSTAGLHKTSWFVKSHHV